MKPHLARAEKRANYIHSLALGTNANHLKLCSMGVNGEGICMQTRGTRGVKTWKATPELQAMHHDLIILMIQNQQSRPISHRHGLSASDSELSPGLVYS